MKESHLLPPVARIGLVVLDDDETLEVDSENIAFQLFLKPGMWKGFFAFAEKVPVSVSQNGDPND